MSQDKIHVDIFTDSEYYLDLTITVQSLIHITVNSQRFEFEVIFLNNLFEFDADLKDNQSLKNVLILKVDF